MKKQILLEKTISNLNRLPDSKIKEVNDFVSFLLNKLDDQILTEGIQDLSSKSKSFEYLNHEPELYSVNDLKVKFK